MSVVVGPGLDVDWMWIGLDGGGCGLAWMVVDVGGFGQYCPRSDCKGCKCEGDGLLAREMG